MTELVVYCESIKRGKEKTYIWVLEFIIKSIKRGLQTRVSVRYKTKNEESTASQTLSWIFSLYEKETNNWK